MPSGVGARREAAVMSGDGAMSPGDVAGDQGATDALAIGGAAGASQATVASAVTRPGKAAKRVAMPSLCEVRDVGGCDTMFASKVSGIGEPSASLLGAMGGMFSASAHWVRARAVRWASICAVRSAATSREPSFVQTWPFFS